MKSDGFLINSYPWGDDLAHTSKYFADFYDFSVKIQDF